MSRITPNLKGRTDQAMTDLAAQQKPGSAGASRGPYKMYYGGEWHDAIDGGYFDDLEPYNGSVFARVPAGGPKDMAAAIDAAAARLQLWIRYRQTAIRSQERGSHSRRHLPVGAERAGQRHIHP